MDNKSFHYQSQLAKSSIKSKTQNIDSDFRKVDINVLLNRVKVDKNKERKKIITSIVSSCLGLCLSAYIIFN